MSNESNDLPSFETLKEQITAGKSLKSLAKKYGVKPYRLKKVIEEAGHTVYELKPTLTRKILEEFDEWKAQGKTYQDIADLLGISRNKLYALLHKYGLKLKGPTRRRYANDEDLQNKADDVAFYIYSNGGSIPAAAKSLGYENITHTIREILKDRGLDLYSHQFKNKRFGSWITLEGKVERVENRLAGNDYLPCRCLRCGTVAQVGYWNLASGKSKSCKSCAKSPALPVSCSQTKQEFKSIRAALIYFDCLNLYASASYHLKKHRRFVINEDTTLVMGGEENG